MSAVAAEQHGQSPEVVTDDQDRQIRSWSYWLTLAVVFLGGATAVALFELFLAGTGLYDNEPRTRMVFVMAMIVGFMAIGVLVALLPIAGWIRAPMLVVLLGGVLSLTLFLALYGTPYALNGLAGDNTFRTALVTKSAAWTWPFPDLAFADLPSFYPPGYYWTLGRLADILDVEPWRMLKIGSLAAAYAAPVLAYVSWRFVTRKAVWALAPAVASLIVIDLYKVEGTLALTLFMPWWIFFVEGVGGRGFKRSWVWFVAGGLVGAVIFQTYFYYFIVGGVMLLLGWGLRRTALWPGTSEPVRNQVLMLLSAALFSIPYWGPFLLSMASTGGWEQLQNRFWRPGYALLEFPFLDASPRGVLMLAGVAWLLYRFTTSRIARTLLLMVVSAYVWMGVAYAAILAGSSMNAVRARTLVNYVLVIAGAFAVGEVLRYLNTNYRRRDWVIPATAVIASLVLFFAQLNASRMVEGDHAENAAATEHPNAMIAAFQEATEGEYEDAVVLSNYHFLYMLLPTHGFQVWNLNVAHAAALWRERDAFLIELSHIDDPEVFAAALMNNRYDTIDYIVLRFVDGEYELRYAVDSFPEEPQPQYLRFPADLFDEAYFELRIVDGYHVFVPRYDRNPLLRSECADLASPACDVGRPLAELFLEHLDQHAVAAFAPATVSDPATAATTTAVRVARISG